MEVCIITEGKNSFAPPFNSWSLRVLSIWLSSVVSSARPERRQCTRPRIFILLSTKKWVLNVSEMFSVRVARQWLNELWTNRISATDNKDQQKFVPNNFRLQKKSIRITTENEITMNENGYTVVVLLHPFLYAETLPFFFGLWRNR